MAYNLRKDKIYQYNIASISWSGAVCFLFVENFVFLIQRSATMPTHAGQVGFVGGHKLDSEESPLETIKREFQEETGILANRLTDLNILEPVKTTMQKVIVPVIAKLNMNKEDFIRNIISNGEWDNAYLVPKSYLFERSNWSRGVMCKGDKDFDIYFCPVPKTISLSKTPVLDDKIILWGATAKIIWNFFKIHIDDASFS